MASIRQDYLGNYSQQNQNVGIGTSIPKEKLEIHGGITAQQDLNVTGIATLTVASGFIKRNLEYSEDVYISSGDSATLSGEIIVGSGLTMSVGTGATAGQGNIDSLKVYDMFQPPSGTTNQRPAAKPGALFYNFDFKTVEFFDGNSWRQVDNTTTRGRAIFAGADQGGTNAMEFVNISTLGNAQFFGDSANTHRGHDRCGSASNSTRGLIAGGRVRTPSLANTDTIGYMTIASGGGTIDFGNLTRTQRMMMGVSSSTRAVFAGGYNPVSDIIDYVEIGTLGNALDFGDLPFANQSGAPFSNGVTGVFGGGYSPSRRAEITKITIASKGDAIEFGTLKEKRAFPGGCSNSTRGIVAGGESPTQIKLIDFITINHGGNATIFGDLTLARNAQAAASSQTRALIGGGGNPSNVRLIDYVQFSTTSDALDFGDLRETGGRFGIALSDSHGGLGGF